MSRRLEDSICVPRLENEQVLNRFFPYTLEERGSSLSTLLPSQRDLKVHQILVFCKLLALFAFTCETQTP